MIFGFNTDVRCGDTVFHVQSEARERELRLQTQVFVSGQCVAKRASSYADAHARIDFSSDQMHDLLRAQHREIIELVRGGRVAEVASPEEHTTPGDTSDEPEPAAAPTSTAPAAPPQLTLEWLNAPALSDQTPGTLQLDFLVSDSGAAVGDARVIVRLNGVAGPAHYAQAVTDNAGHAIVPLSFDVAAHGELVSLLVQASCEGRTVTRKFHLRRNG
jgi:hypothetical protein